MRFRLLLPLVAGLGLALASAPVRPNLLFILTEDQGAHLGLLGTPGLQTPHLDALARSGVYFERAFVAYPVCSPSKACLYTGLHAHTTGLLNNTPNFHKPAAALTPQERQQPLYVRNRVQADLPTLIERLRDAGYYQGVTHKLHVAPNEKFPYDEFIAAKGGRAVADFLVRARRTGRPWHLFYNLADSHRPFPNSERVPLRIDPAAVRPPAFLPATPGARRDWAEYLAAIERTDRLVGEGWAAVCAAGEADRTLVVMLGDHGPAFAHGKMTLHDLGLRVPLIIRVPGLPGGRRTDALASTLDLTPTVLDLLGLPPLPRSHGLSLRSVLEGQPGATGHDAVFAEISARGPLPNDGMQERSVCDGRWHLIYREKLSPPWRQVQADSKDEKPWGNRTYAETVRHKAQFPVAFRILAEMDPQSLGGRVPALELYDLHNDPDELHNLADDDRSQAELRRLYRRLDAWVRATADPAVHLPPEPPRD